MIEIATLSTKNSLILRENKADFHREGHNWFHFKNDKIGSK